jgi:glucose/arabinose dehydrogenase
MNLGRIHNFSFRNLPARTRRVVGVGLIGMFFVALGCGWAGDASDLKLNVPDGVRLTVFADKVPKARHMAFDDQNILFLSRARDGKVVALPDNDKNGKADRSVPILDGRRAPHGLAFVQLDSGYYLYVAEEDRVVRLKRTAKPFTYGKPEVLVAGIPTGGHFTRTIKIKNNKMYVSIGSSCNVCIEDSPLRAAIWQYDLDGKNGKLFAAGLRNSVGIEFSPYSGELWGVNNGRDWQGDDHPREELNIIKEGKDYGWPRCHENSLADPEYGKGFDCAKTEPPAYTFTAHMAPLGLEFYQKGNLPAKYNNSLFVSFHGSWNRSVPAGYKVVRVILNDKGEIQSHEDFITGWLLPDGSKQGRPVDVQLSPDGDLYLSDDSRGVVYRISEK